MGSPSWAYPHAVCSSKNMKTMKTMKSIKSIKNIKSLKNMKSIKNLEIVESMEDMKNIKNMKSINDVGTTIKNTKIWQDIENINTKTATTGDCASERQESLPAVNEAFESLKVAQMNGDVPSASDTAILLDYCIMLEVKLDKERELAQKALSQEKQIADNEIIDIKTKFHALRRDWITREIQFKDQVKKLELKLCEESLQGMEAVYETRRYSLLDTSKTFQRSVQELLDMKDCEPILDWYPVTFTLRYPCLLRHHKRALAQARFADPNSFDLRHRLQ